MNIIFIGFKGCGKSSIGRIVATALGKDFIDTDSIIESVYKEKKKIKLSCREIFKQKGEDYFQLLEREALEKIKHMQDKVISLGGGTLFAGINAEKLTENHTTVFINVQADILYKRIIKDGIPAFFKKENTMDNFKKLYDNRIPAFQKYAKIIIENSNTSIENTAKDVIKKIKDYHAG